MIKGLILEAYQQELDEISVVQLNVDDLRTIAPVLKRYTHIFPKEIEVSYSDPEKTKVATVRLPQYQNFEITWPFKDIYESIKAGNLINFSFRGPADIQALTKYITNLVNSFDKIYQDNINLFKAAGMDYTDFLLVQTVTANHDNLRFFLLPARLLQVMGVAVGTEIGKISGMSSFRKEEARKQRLADMKKKNSK